MSYEPMTRVSEHHLQLFDSSKTLAETVSDFLFAGFERGEPLLIVARPYHRHLLTERLESKGLDIRTQSIANRICLLDAAETLDKFMRQGMPNPAAFDEVIGNLVHRLSDGKRVCIYGEMVDILADQGQYKAAQQLEELWNGLGRREYYALFCGYASGHFGDPRTAKVLGAIRGAHTHLHRHAGDLLAEYLLEQPDVKSMRDFSPSNS